MLSPSSKITNPETASQLKVVKDSSSNRVNDLLLHKSLAITLHDNLLTVHDSNKAFKLKRDLLKMITNKI